jgi:hypothetical protein
MMELKKTVLAATLICGAAFPNPAMAQAQPAPAAPAPAAAASPAQDLLKAEQLDQLLAPIALYPDNLLAQTLMASTYPLEVVEASRWADENKNLKGDQLKTAIDGQTWDESVKSLVATPSVLSMMSTKLSWTQKLGDAVLAQQPDVMDSVQRLRARAQASKKLETTKEQTVSVKTEQNKQMIVIESAQPDTVYVPYYNPSVVYGEWPYASYPPYYFPPAAGYYAGAALATGLAFGAGVAIGRWASGGYWGGNMGWGNNNINVNRSTNINNINAGNRGGNWQHNPQHRQGVRYGNANVATQFGKGNQVRGGAAGQDFRGRGGDQVLRPGGGAGGGAAGDRGGQRPAAGGGDRRPGASGGGNRQNAGNRGGGSRPTAATRPSGAGNRGGGGRDNAMSNVGGGGRDARAQSSRGHSSMGGGGGARGGGGGGMRAGGGGGGRGGGGGGGRRSDVTLKHDITLLGQLDNGLGFYRFSYNGSDKPYVGVMAQEVQVVMPDAVSRGRDGTLRVHYEMLGLKFQTYDQWIGSGARVPVRAH